MPDQSNMKRVLIIAHAFPPFSPVGHSIRIVKFIKYLPGLGWLPVVLTVDDRQEYETLRKVGSETLLQEIEPQVKIVRTIAGEPSLEYLRNEQELGGKGRLGAVVVKCFGGARRWIFRNALLPDRAITWLPFAVGRGRKIVQSEDIEVIFATCPPHSVAVLAVVLKLLTNKRLILDFRDDWIDTPWYDAMPTLFRWIHRKLEGWAVKTADKVILVTDWSKNAFLKRYPTQPHDKFVFIPNGCDLFEYDGQKSEAIPRQNSKFMIVYAGSLNVSKVWGRSPAGFFQAVQRILRQHPELKDKLDIIFAGQLPEEFRKLADEMGLLDVISVLGQVPHNEVARLTKSADLLLAINYDGWSTLIPGKIYEYWAVGGPPILLLSCAGAAAELVERYHLGITVEPYDVDGIQLAIQNAYGQSMTATRMRLSTTGIEAFDRRVLAGKLVEVLSEIT